MSNEEKEVVDRPTNEDVADTDESADGAPDVTGEFSLDELRALANELERTQDQIKRQAAEFQNYRRRTEQEKAQMVEFGKKLVVEQLLDIIDDFQRSLEAATEAAEEEESSPAFDSLRSGVEMVYAKLMDELGKLGVETIDAVGEPFDEELHEALMQQPAPEGTEPGTVLTEIQQGYRLGDRVIRHARVVVAT